MMVEDPEASFRWGGKRDQWTSQRTCTFWEVGWYNVRMVGHCHILCVKSDQFLWINPQTTDYFHFRLDFHFLANLAATTLELYAENRKYCFLWTNSRMIFIIIIHGCQILMMNTKINVMGLLEEKQRLVTCTWRGILEILMRSSCNLWLNVALFIIRRYCQWSIDHIWLVLRLEKSFRGATLRSNHVVPVLFIFKHLSSSFFKENCR